MAALLVALVLALPLHGMWRLFGRKSPWPPRFLGLVSRIVGARPRVVGTPLRHDVVFVSNHLSWIDILLLSGATGTAFVAKSELRGVPLVGWLCTLNHTIFVSRADRMAVTAQIAQIRDTLAADWPVTLFPEGTTGDGTTLLPFKAALLAALAPPPPGVKVQPVRIDYGAATGELAWVGDEPGQHHAARVLKRRGTFVATLHFADAFDPAEYGDRKAIAAEARRRMEAL
ncbi:1-acyl-sn-glycerol-3-phosphate acyltransferase [Sphingomonas sp. PP-CE-3G-477]|uniref:lysophospholipid acyltransferase family protein n=1 Tax=Sphingomonas sp. PP-CE-3G-477 TaxID=2135660 RepID=UPI000D4E4060|nr:lysophospholipid acyltransferase family protein [Sphingomonas sp. PP-CE-3G-477]PTQ64329.1 1-acyl-sn-glycerol-3-phosphate acyltransferase [Sphingomonas sp. PP-CE-3G-477]